MRILAACTYQQKAFIMKKYILLVFSALLFFVEATGAQEAFPSAQPEDGNFNRPRSDEVLDISPPGFCWWRAAPRGEVQYRLLIESESGESVYQSGLLGDPVHDDSLYRDR